MELIDFLNIISIAFGIIFSILIFVYKRKSSITFSVFLFNICFVLGYFLILNQGLNNVGIFLLPLFMTSVLTLGPLLWIYINKVTGEKSIHYLKQSFYLPVGYNTILLILLGLRIYFDFDAINLTLQYYVVFGLTLLFLSQNIYYIIKGLKLYKLHQIQISNSYSYTEKINLKWLRILILGYVIFIIGLVIAHLVNDSISFYIFYITILIYIVFSGYQALVQNPVYRIQNNIKNTPTIDINNEFFNELLTRLINKLEYDKLYLNNSLNIQQVSDELKTNNKYISTLINQHFEMNFVSFINKYRIEEAKRLLKSKTKKHLTIEGIGNESGFKSKSAFNSAFKKFTGQTPSEYLKN